MKQYILTRSAYGPAIPIRRNRTRLALLRGVTARSLAAQTLRDVTWLVLVDPADPLLGLRKAALASSGLRVQLAAAGGLIRTSRHDRPAGPWAAHIDWSESVVTSRLDDDDALAPTVLESYRRHAEAHDAPGASPAVWVCRSGWWVVRGLAELRNDPLAPFSALYSPAGTRRTVMDANHMLVGSFGPITEAEPGPSWLWIRHRETRSLRARPTITMRPITWALRQAFPVDWKLIEGLR